MHRLLTAAIVAVCALDGTAADAATIFTTNLATFSVSNPGLVLEDFEGAVLASGAQGSAGTSLSSTTNTAIFPTGSVIDGFTLTPTFGDIYVSRDFGGNVGANVSSNFFTADINITFAPLVTAIGIDLLQWSGNTGGWTVQVFDAGNVLLGSFVTSGPSFVGVTSDTPIGRLFLNKPDSGAVIDNLRFGAAATAVPEPATLTLVGLGALAALRRRRAR